jgi:putative spermidine/putrescine transport system permease protein
MMTPKLRWACLVAAAWSVLTFLMLPTLVAIPVSLTPERYLSLPTNGISFSHYETLFTDAGWVGSALQSFFVAAVASFIATFLGTLTAIGLWRLSSWLGEVVRMVALAPMIVPPIVSALAFYRIFADLHLIDTYLGVILAHALLGVPYVLITVAASLSMIDARQEQASRSLGASGTRTMVSVILPQIMPGVAAGAVFAFVTSWDEVVVTLFIAARAVYTLPRKMWDGINDNIDPTIAAAATVLFILTVMIAIVQIIRRQRVEA